MAHHMRAPFAGWHMRPCKVCTCLLPVLLCEQTMYLMRGRPHFTRYMEFPALVRARRSNWLPG